MMQRDIDEAEALLIKWADYMLNPGAYGADYPDKASGGFIASWIKDSEELFELADEGEITKIGTAIDDLAQPHKRIIYKRHGVGYKVWSFPNEDALYLAAKTAFRVKFFGR